MWKLRYELGDTEVLKWKVWQMKRNWRIVKLKGDKKIKKSMGERWQRRIKEKMDRGVEVKVRRKKILAIDMGGGR